MCCAPIPELSRPALGLPRSALSVCDTYTSSSVVHNGRRAAALTYVPPTHSVSSSSAIVLISSTACSLSAPACPKSRVSYFRCTMQHFPCWPGGAVQNVSHVAVQYKFDYRAAPFVVLNHHQHLFIYCLTLTRVELPTESFICSYSRSLSGKVVERPPLSIFPHLSSFVQC